MERKLHPNVIRYWQIERALFTAKWILKGCVPITIHLLWLKTWNWLLVVSIFVISFFVIKGLVFICYGVHVKYSRRSYSIGQDELMIRWGNVWSDNSSIIPFSRVQHVDKEQDMIARKLGLAELVITTAGDAHFILGLLEEDAERLRRQVIELSKIGETHAYYD